MSVISHGLGFLHVHGTIIENTANGTAQFRPGGKILPAFSVRIADVTGVSWKKKGLLHVTMFIHGQGTVLAEAEVNHGTSELVEQWFRSRIGLGATRTSHTNPISMTDQLVKLAELHSQGVLSDTEFANAKSRIIG